jgi:tetratricopeptide (TPR) repeat protein
MKNNDVYKKRIEKFLKLFGEDFYFEIGYHYFPDQRFVNEKIIKLAELYNRIPIIVNDSHYLEKEDWYVQTVLFKKIFNIRREYSAETQDSYLKTEQEMELLGYKREFLDKTMEVFNKVEIVNPLDVIKGSKSKKEICLSGKIHTLTAKEALDYGAFYFNKENAVANRFQDKSVSLSEYYNSDKNIKEFLDSNPLISEAAFKLEGVTTNIVPDFENIVLADDNLPCNLFAGKLKFSQFDNEDIAEVYEIKNIEIYKIYFDNAVKIKNFTEAIDFYEKDVFDTAIPKFENFLADKEYEIEANFYLGNCYYFKNQMYKAIDFYEKIMDSDLELDKKYLLYYFYGWCCYRVLKNQEKALEYMEKAIDLASFKPTAYYGAGLINYYMKNDKAAKEYFESFLKYSKNQNKKNKVNEILLKIENYLKRG